MLRTTGWQRVGALSERGAEPAHASTARCGFSRPWLLLPLLRLRSARPGCWPAGKAATYTHPETAVAFIISELPGERAEALFIAMAALVPTAGEHFTYRPGLRLHRAVVSA